jgi:hypothetical protein
VSAFLGVLFLSALQQFPSNWYTDMASRICSTRQPAFATTEQVNIPPQACKLQYNPCSVSFTHTFNLLSPAERGLCLASPHGAGEPPCEGDLYVERRGGGVLGLDQWVQLALGIPVLLGTSGAAVGTRAQEVTCLVHLPAHAGRAAS